MKKEQSHCGHGEDDEKHQGAKVAPRRVGVALAPAEAAAAGDDEQHDAEADEPQHGDEEEGHCGVRHGLHAQEARGVMSEREEEDERNGCDVM